MLSEIDMKYIIIGVIAVLSIALSVMIFLKHKKSTIKTSSANNEITEPKKDTSLVQTNTNLPDFTIQMEMLPAEYITDENKLVEITDSKVLARVNNLVPELAKAGNVANNAVQAVKDGGEVLYRAIIPVGAKLTDSKAMEGAVRGIYHGTDGIRGHANLIAVEAQKGTAVAANTAAAAMGVASMVVGQYYMTQINAELGRISEGISKISDFQDNEYRSKVFSLMAHVKKIADFQIEILENEELRSAKIQQLDSLEEECTQLLGQANLTLADYTEKTDIDYSTYEKELPEAQNWYMYQKSLLDILYKIAELRYTLHLGNVSKEHCASLLPLYTSQTEKTQELLTGWHQTTTERLKIDISETRRKRVGFDGAVHFIPGLFKDELNFRTIGENTAEMIKTQSSGTMYKYDATDLYSEDVQLISKNGKIYYLPTESTDKKA